MGLLFKHEPAGQRYDACLDALLPELTSRLESDADLGAG